ncbi:MAG: hypothetical protein CMJ31_07835 [Phycisphaerae bacterium]|nr:hypothetical protein [Phycisphaerae bacterium]
MKRLRLSQATARRIRERVQGIAVVGDRGCGDVESDPVSQSAAPTAESNFVQRVRNLSISKPPTQVIF